MKHKGKIFLLDDEELIATMLTRALKKDGYKVRMETSTGDIIDKIKAFDPDVVILDMDNRFTNSTLELLQVLTALPNIKVIGLSLQHNAFQVYQANQKDAHSTSDLIEAIAS